MFIRIIHTIKTRYKKMIFVHFDDERLLNNK